MEDLKNLFEVKKTVRFELKPYIETRKYLKWNNDYSTLNSYISHIKMEEFEKWFDWNEFCKSQYSDFLDKTEYISEFLEEVINELNKKNNDKKRKSIQFNFKWFKWVFKNIPSLKNIESFPRLKEKIEEMTESYKSSITFFDFKKDNDDKQSNQKQSDVSKELRKLAYLNRNFLTIFKYLWSNNGNETDEGILKKYEEVKNKLWENFKKLNSSIIASHQNETSGACIWKYTLNKYSLFRRETRKLKEKSRKSKKAIDKDVDFIIKNWIYDDKWFEIKLKKEDITNITLKTDFSDNFEKHIESLWLQYKLENFNFNRSLDEVIEELDLINAQLLNTYITYFKEEYEEFWESLLDIDFQTEFKIDNEWNNKPFNIYNNKSKPPKIRKLWYFSNEEGKYITLNQWQTLEWYEYLNLLDLEQKDLTDEEKYQKKLANKFLQIIFKQDFINRDYNNIKQFRDKLSKYRGKLRQDVKNSEREFISEGMIRYFWSILEKDWNYFLALTEKVDINWENKIDSIENIEIENTLNDNCIEWYFKIYKYHQLSFSAIEKLCLLKDWPDADNEKLIKYWDKYKYQKKDFKDYKDKSDFLSLFKKQIIDLVYLLKSDNKYNWYDFSSFLPKIEKFNSVEQIIEFIDHNFYKLEEKYISEEKLFKLADNKDILLFQIYNKDFNIYDERFLSNEENIKEEKYSEKRKLLEIIDRKKDAKPNLFTLYWKDIFKNEAFLGQEWGVFFRKADLEKEEKRFRNNKFLVSFDVRFYKWKTIWDVKICDKKAQKTEKSYKKITLNYFNEIINKDKITILGIDRWSISSAINEKTKIAMLWFCVITLKKEKSNYILEDIVRTWDINWLIKETIKERNVNYIEFWKPVKKASGIKIDIDFKNVLLELKNNIMQEIEKKWQDRRDLQRILDKKIWLTSFLVNEIQKVIVEYDVNYVALENLDNIFNSTNKISFKKELEINTLSNYLYQNFETQLLNKLQLFTTKTNYNNKKQFIPNFKIDELKELPSNNWFLHTKTWKTIEHDFKDFKILWNTIFVWTAGTSSECFNCWEKIKKHWLICKNCNIDDRLKLKDYQENFVSKSILQNMDLQSDSKWKKLFNNDVRAWLVIAKKAKEYLEFLEKQKNNNS